MRKQIKNICVLGCFLAAGLISFASSANAANAKKDWTMLVYLNGNNSLDDFGAFNINQMEKVGSTDHLNVVVQWASLQAGSTKRLLVQKDSDEAKVTSPTVQEMGKVDMGDKTSLLDFIKWGADTYPAQHYMVVVWNHGAGWHLKMNTAIRNDMHINDISYDDNTGHKITTEELGTTMLQAAAYLNQKIDIYGSDACLMAMAEVAQEMAGGVNVFVGSQELEPGDGWPYDRFLQAWTANPAASAADVGKMLVTSYHDYYTDQGNDQTTFSAIDMRELSVLLTNVKNLKNRLMSMSDLSAVKAAAAKSARYYYQDYVDLVDLISNVKSALNKTGEAQIELEQVAAQMNRVIIANATTGLAGNGLSVWWPTDKSDWDQYGKRYQGLKFDQATGWSQLLQKSL
jgi:hypothetical protein